MRVLAIANQKGGSGKTTTTVNLAAALGERERRVLLLDLDPQASTSHWYRIQEAEGGLLDVLTEQDNLLDHVHSTDVAGVDVIPSSTRLAGIEKALAREVGAETILRRKLQRLPAARWEYVLLDCPPTLGILTVNALTAAPELLVPVEAHVMALHGLAQLIETVGLIKERLNPDLELAGILACRVDNRTRHAQEVVEELRTRFGATVYDAVIRENVRLAECPSFGRPITQYEPRSAGAADYRALADEVIHQERNR